MLLLRTGFIRTIQCLQGDMFCIDDGPYFPSLETLVDHYLHFVDGLPCQLRTPVGPSQSLMEDTTSSRSPLLPVTSVSVLIRFS